MTTLERFRLESESRRLTVPVATAWLVGELGESLGKQALFERQAPQRLSALRQHALIESAISSNRLEGVEIAVARRVAVVGGKGRLADRAEAEVRGYRDALRLIHEHATELGISERTIRALHRTTRAGEGDAGRYRRRDLDIIERHADGRTRVRFRAVAGPDVAPATRRLIGEYQDSLAERVIPAALAAAAFNLDFLCVHPFRDGNGRVSRLLFLLQSYHWGCQVGRYVSLERIVEENRERYYETLEASSQGWHDGRHDPWPYINFLLYVLQSAFKEFERRVGETAEPRGAKTMAILDAIGRLPGDFSINDLRRLCPAVSVDMARRVLKQQRELGRLLCLGRGPNARWRDLSRGLLGNSRINR